MSSVRGRWDELALKNAVNAVLQCSMSKKRAALEYSIPRPTLIRHVEKASTGLGVEKRLGRPPVLNEAEELELSQLIQDTEKRLYGLTALDVKKLVFNYCSRKGIKSTFNGNEKAAGRNWLKKCMVRHPEIAVRKPEAVSVQRAIGFNKTKVDRFYDLLEGKVYVRDGQRKIPASNISNVDETGFSVVQEPAKTLAKKRKKYVGALNSAEKGKTITAV